MYYFINNVLYMKELINKDKHKYHVMTKRIKEYKRTKFKRICTLLIFQLSFNKRKKEI